MFLSYLRNIPNFFDLQEISYKAVVHQYEINNYKFNKEPEAVNLFGIRTGPRTTNLFDDYLGICKLDKEGNPVTYLWQATTDPGLKYFKKPINRSGVACLVPDQYIDCYSVGKHFNYTAIVQTRNVKVYRDNNRDLTYDWLPDSIQEGRFGINIHKRNSKGEEVNGSSAGCQVFKDIVDFKICLNLMQKERKRTKRNKFTYTLFSCE